MLFSIVIPVYNVEKYLEECLQSILKQVEQIDNDCEILLIDDGSTDSSGKICDEYREKHPEIIKVFHNANRGLLLTRRFGFERVKGEYIINCDSDDFLENGALKKLKNTIEKYKQPDIIIFNYYSYDGKNKNIVFDNLFTRDKDCLIEKKSVLKEYLIRQSIVSMWGKIIKRKCINNEEKYSEFGKISTGEDTLQSIEFFNKAETFAYLNEPLYNYRYSSGMTRKFDENYYFTFKKIFKQIEKQKEQWNLDNFEELFAVKVLQMAGRSITQSRYKRWKLMREHINYLKKIKEDEMFQNNVPFLKRVKEKLQYDHWILIKLLEKKQYVLICLMLDVKNKIG